MRIFLLALALCSLGSAAVAQDSRVASYYLNDPEKYEGKKITLSASYVERQNSYGVINGKVVFWAYTASRTDWKSAYIEVHVPEDNAGKFAKKFGHDVEWDVNGNRRTRPLSGIFTRGNGTFYVDYIPPS